MCQKRSGIERKITDWRDESAYPKPGELSMSDWAAQFALRSEIYQRETENNSGSRKASGEIKGLQCQIIMREGGGVRYTKSFDSELLSLEGEYLERNYFGMDAERCFGRPHHPRYLDIRFNLETPIEPQIKEAKKLLDDFKKSLTEKGTIKPMKDTKINVKLFPIYLRLLDAELQGASREEMIQKIISPNRQQHSDWHRATNYLATTFNNQMRSAKVLRDGGFEKLLYWDKES